MTLDTGCAPHPSWNSPQVFIRYFGDGLQVKLLLTTAFRADTPRSSNRSNAPLLCSATMHASPSAFNCPPPPLPFSSPIAPIYPFVCLHSAACTGTRVKPPTTMITLLNDHPVTTQSPHPTPSHATAAAHADLPTVSGVAPLHPSEQPDSFALVWKHNIRRRCTFCCGRTGILHWSDTQSAYIDGCHSP